MIVSSMTSLLLETYPGIETEHDMLTDAWLFFLNNPNIVLIIMHIVVIMVAFFAYKLFKY